MAWSDFLITSVVTMIDTSCNTSYKKPTTMAEIREQQEAISVNSQNPRGHRAIFDGMRLVGGK
jgi:hypothetical protein